MSESQSNMPPRQQAYQGQQGVPGQQHGNYPRQPYVGAPGQVPGSSPAALQQGADQASVNDDGAQEHSQFRTIIWRMTQDGSIVPNDKQQQNGPIAGATYPTPQPQLQLQQQQQHPGFQKQPGGGQWAGGPPPGLAGGAGAAGYLNGMGMPAAQYGVGGMGRSGEPRRDQPAMYSGGQGHGQGAQAPYAHTSGPVAALTPAQAATTGVTAVAPGVQGNVTAKADGQQGHLIVLFGCKGGVGNTFTAINLAVSLAQEHNVCLVDMDLQMGDVLVSLNMEGRGAFSHLIREVRKEGDSLNPRTILDRHTDTGISVVSQVNHLEELGMITPTEVANTFQFLKGSFPFTVVDGIRGFDDLSMPILDVADTVIFVVNQDVASVRSAGRTLDVFRRIGYDESRVVVVVNSYHKREVIKPVDIARSLRLNRVFTLRRDERLVLRSLNEGKPVLLLAPQSRILRDMEAVAEAIPDKRSSQVMKTAGGKLVQVKTTGKGKAPRHAVNRGVPGNKGAGKATEPAKGKGANQKSGKGQSQKVRPTGVKPGKKRGFFSALFKKKKVKRNEVVRAPSAK